MRRRWLALSGVGNQAVTTDKKLQARLWTHTYCITLTGLLKKLGIGSDRTKCPVMA